MSLSLVAGCKKKEAPADAVTPPSPTAPGTPLATSPSLPLLDKLAYEAKHRPTSGVHVDDFWSVLEKNGLPLTEKQQHVAGVFGARYCVGAKTTADVIVDVCEFDDDATAQTGKASSEKAFAAVPNRTLAMHKAAVLTVRQPATATPESEAATKKALELFNAQ